MSTDLRSSNKRYVELDSLRGLAAITVFFSHAINMINLEGRSYANLIDKTVLHLFWDGTAAVILFFVLSGFVLALPYVGENGKRVDLIPFIIRRVFRIYPAYYAALGISLLLKFYVFRMGGLNGLTQFMTQFWDWPNNHLTWASVIKHMIMIGPEYQMGQIDPIIWSLVVEMKVSLIFPFIIPLIRKVKTFWGAGALMILSIALYEVTKGDLLSYIPLFILGGLLARFKDQLIGWFSKLNAPAYISIGVVALILYTFRFCVPRIEILNDTRINYIIGLGVALIILLVVSRPKLSATLSLKPFKYLGEISYSFYLLHFPVLLTIASLMYPGSRSVKLIWPISLVIALILPYFTYRFIEKPFQNIGRTLAKRAKPLQDIINSMLPWGESTNSDNSLKG